jgi:ubiquinone biosynthesis monooxygenase Coq7
MTLDELITEFDRGLRSMAGVSRMSRPIPVSKAAGNVDEYGVPVKWRS